MNNKNMDMLHGSLADKILRFALPLAFTGILQQMFNAADIAVVGQFVGKSAMAAVGSNAPVIGILVNFFVGISLGTNVVIAQQLGAGNKSRVSRAAHTSIVVAVLGGILVTLIGELCMEPLLGFLSVPDDVVELSALYLKIYFAGIPVVLLYNFEASILRSIGDTRTPLYVLVISGVLNVLLNLFFVIVVHMTVDGVALATIASNAVSAVILFVVLLRTDSPVRIEIKKLGIDISILKRILKIGVPAGIQGMIFSLANICIQSGINSLGTTVMAASSAAFNVEVFAYYIFNSFGQACTTFTGQNYGAGNYDRCKKVMRYSLVMDMVFTLSICGLILLFGKALLGLFTGDTEVIDTGYIRLVYIFSAYIFSLIGDIFSGYMRGFGMSFIPAIVALISICGVRIFWVYAIFPHNATFSNLLMVYPISLCCQAVVMLILYFMLRKRIYSLD